jgi:hypothetical protein
MVESKFQDLHLLQILYLNVEKIGQKEVRVFVSNESQEEVNDLLKYEILNLVKK